MLTGSLRHDWAYSSTADYIFDTFVDQYDKALSGRLGLNYLFENGVAPYVAWSTSFDPTIGVDSSGQPFKPTTGRQFEIGIKYQPPGRKIFMAVSAFDLIRRNVLTRDPNPPATNPFAQIQTGEVHVQGLELEAKATLPNGLNVAAAYTSLDSRITPSNNDDLGFPLFFTPTHQAALWADYTLQETALAGFGLGGGLRFRSSVWGLSYEILAPSYTLFDAAVHYDFGRLSPRLEGVRFELNARNLFDAQYIATCSYQEGCFYGDRRTILATMRMRM
jgi:iron complex outermembrane receptor protein